MNDREKLIDILESAESAVYWNSECEKGESNEQVH